MLFANSTYLQFIFDTLSVNCDPLPEINQMGLGPNNAVTMWNKMFFVVTLESRRILGPYVHPFLAVRAGHQKSRHSLARQE